MPCGHESRFMEDYWIRSVTEDGAVRAMAAVTTATVEQARRRHGTAPTATAALGRSLTAAGLLGASLRVGQTIVVRILGDGPLGGVIVQVMPGADERTVSYLEQRAKALPAVTSMISGGNTPEEMVEAALGEMPSQVVERGAVRFRCRCSRRKVQRVLISFGETELREILAEQGRVEVRCNFCASRYLFDGEAVENLISGMRNGSRGTRERGNGETIQSH